MNDRELLELAAKAAGLGRLVWWEDQNCYQLIDQDGPPRWNPLTDDGDALRLAVKLSLTDGIESLASEIAEEVNYDMDPFEATRRAIVSAAAEIGSQMK